MTEQKLPSLAPDPEKESSFDILPHTMTNEEFNKFAIGGEITGSDQKILARLGGLGLQNSLTPESDTPQVALVSRIDREGNTRNDYVVVSGDNVGDRVSPKRWEEYGLPDATDLAEKRQAQSELEEFNDTYKPLQEGFDTLVAMQTDMDRAADESGFRGALDIELNRQFNLLDQQEPTVFITAAQLSLASAQQDPERFAFLFESAAQKLDLNSDQQRVFEDLKDRLKRLKAMPGDHAAETQRQLSNFIEDIYRISLPDSNDAVAAALSIAAGASFGGMRHLQDRMAEADRFIKDKYSPQHKV